LLSDLKKLKMDFEAIEVMLMLIDDTYIKYEDIEETMDNPPLKPEIKLISLKQSTNPPDVPLIDEEIFHDSYDPEDSSKEEQVPE